MYTRLEITAARHDRKWHKASAVSANPYATWRYVAEELDRVLGFGEWHVICGDVSDVAELPPIDPSRW